MPASINRKNGKQASCEPCRKGKVRCDHRLPICGRCHRRNIGSECWYHPAPLTQLGKRPHSPTVGILRASPNIADGPTTHISAHERRDQSPVDDNPGQTHQEDRASPDFAPTIPSRVTLPWLSLADLDPKESDHAVPTVVYDDRGNATYDEDLECVVQVLNHLKLLEPMKKLVHEFYRLDQAALVPGQLVLPVILDLERIHESITHSRSTTNDTTIHTIAAQILRSTSSKIEITPSLSLAEFRLSYSGEHLRIETIGLVYAIAARACLDGLAHDDGEWHDFVQSMFLCSARCIYLARELAPRSNDIMVWLSYENLRLTANIQGYANPNVWRRLGDFSTDVLALDIHRESVITKAPFFLAECRRRIFAAAYQADKVLAALSNRPPRISGRHSDCRLPLDIADDKLFSLDAAVEEQALLELSNGWSMDGAYHSVTWTRLVRILSQFREDTLECQFLPSTDDSIVALREIASRCKATWTSLPSHLQYKPGCWHSKLTSTICLKLAEVYLLYLQIHFHIQRLLEKRNSCHSPDLLEVCTKVVETVSEIASSRDYAIYVRRSFPSIVLYHGLPSAIILTSHLKTTRRNVRTQTQATFPPRSTLIRRLSVFISYLESICNPGDSDYSICMQASRVISRTIDEVLEYPTSSTIPIPSSEILNATHDPSSQYPTTNTESMSFPDEGLADWSTSDLLDVNGWIDNINWTTVSGGTCI